VFLKCEEKIPDNRLKFRFFFGAPNKKGEYQHFSAGIDHDFSKNLTGGLEVNADWDFKQFVDRGVLTIGAEAVAQGEDIEFPTSWSRQDGGGTSGVGGTATIKPKKAATEKVKSGQDSQGLGTSAPAKPSTATTAPPSMQENLMVSGASEGKETFQY
jgi:hypothetical protein